MIQSKDWYEFLRKYMIELGILLVGLLSGMAYAIYTIKKGQISMEVVRQYFEYQPQSMTTVELLWGFWGYEKKILLVWVLAFIKWLNKVALLVTSVYIFAYSFAMILLLVNFNGSNNVLSLSIFVIQGILMIGFLLIFCKKNVLNGDDIHKGGYIKSLMGSVVVSGAMLGIEMLSYLV